MAKHLAPCSVLIIDSDNSTGDRVKSIQLDIFILDIRFYPIGSVVDKMKVRLAIFCCIPFLSFDFFAYLPPPLQILSLVLIMWYFLHPSHLITPPLVNI